MKAFQRQRLEEVMPFYVNGTASERDRAFVEVMLLDADAKVMLEWHQKLAEKVRVQVESASDNVGWNDLVRKAHLAQTKKHVPAAGWLDWLSLGRWLTPSWQGPVFAALCVLVLVQGVFLYRTDDLHWNDADYSAVRGVALPPVGSSAQSNIKVNFKDETTEHDLRMLLVATGANIVQGPGQLGDYVLSVPSERANAALEDLRVSKWVNSVQLMKAPKPVAP